MDSTWEGPTQNVLCFPRNVHMFYTTQIVGTNTTAQSHALSCPNVTFNHLSITLFTKWHYRCKQTKITRYYLLTVQNYQ